MVEVAAVVAGAVVSILVGKAYDREDLTYRDCTVECKVLVKSTGTDEGLERCLEIIDSPLPMLLKGQ